MLCFTPTLLHWRCISVISWLCFDRDILLARYCHRSLLALPLFVLKINCRSPASSAAEIAKVQNWPRAYVGRPLLSLVRTRQIYNHTRDCQKPRVISRKKKIENSKLLRGVISLHRSEWIKVDDKMRRILIYVNRKKGLLFYLGNIGSVLFFHSII